MTQMLELADKDFKAVPINMPKDLKEMMSIMSKQMGNLSREWIGLQLTRHCRERTALMNLRTGQQKLGTLKHTEEKKV